MPRRARASTGAARQQRALRGCTRSCLTGACAPEHTSTSVAPLRQRCCCSPPRHLGFPAPRRIRKIVGSPHRMSCCRGVRLFTSSPASTALQPQRQPRPALRSWHQSPASASSQMSGMDGVRGIAVRAIVRLRLVSVTGPPQHQRSSLQTIPSGRMPQRVPKACTSLRRILSLRRSSRRKRSVSI